MHAIPQVSELPKIVLIQPDGREAHFINVGRTREASAGQVVRTLDLHLTCAGSDTWDTRGALFRLAARKVVFHYCQCCRNVASAAKDC